MYRNELDEKMRIHNVINKNKNKRIRRQKQSKAKHATIDLTRAPIHSTRAHDPPYPRTIIHRSAPSDQPPHPNPPSHGDVMVPTKADGQCGAEHRQCLPGWSPPSDAV